MSDKIALIQNLKNRSVGDRAVLSGINKFQFCAFLSVFEQTFLKNKIFLLPTEEDAEYFYSCLQTESKKYLFPGIGSTEYTSSIPSESALFKRFNVAQALANNSDTNLCVVTSIQAAMLYLPPMTFFIEDHFSIEITDIISPLDLSQKLVQLGYEGALTAEEKGTFSSRGEIFDIFPLTGVPIRINFFDDMIESIHEINLSNFRTNKEKPVEKLTLHKSPHSLLEDSLIQNFRDKLPRVSHLDKELYESRAYLLKKLKNNQLFEDYPLFIKLFFDNPTSLLSFTSNSNLIFIDSFNIEQEFFNLKESLTNDYEYYLKSDYKTYKLPPEEIYSFNEEHLNNFTIKVNELDLNESEHVAFFKLPLNIQELTFPSKKEEKHIQLIKHLKEYSSKKYKFYFLHQKQESIEEFKYILNTLELDLKVIYKRASLKNGFIYHTESLVFLTEADLFGEKILKAKKTIQEKTNDLFADQLSTLKHGDFIIHKEFGVGKFIGLETLTLNNSTSDYLTIQYQDNDKVYVPVYRLSLLQKYANETSQVSIANLKTKKFEQSKNKIKKSIKKLAFDLLELQAKRKLLKSYEFSPPSHLYNEFALAFKYIETPDQLSAIDDVLNDMQSPNPMDRLICGDVGFGKTEIAMRASYISVIDNKQVCILVPTTVLCLQHFNSFTERFKNFPVNISMLSRFCSPKQTTQTLDNLSQGKVDILIGTHKVLSDKVKFKDLGLIIIDEEQRFGVAHKEKLKIFRETIDSLTLTATPIPRTLQMSFLGIKELSIIKTAPPKRQSIKTYIIKDDKNTLKLAIEKELKRGGQVFIVHNKVSDIEIYSSKIRELVPKARIVFAHGQLSTRELENRISDFYRHKFDILIATTIIESGIDIPNANTMIIDRADTFGLSQLHQLRGRIGRSDKKAYAYFMIPNTRNLSEIASKRLKAIQTYAEIGSGFSLASSDLEIRGSGDILGPEQSGHLDSIGLELYMELLQEAIREIKGTDKAILFEDIEISSTFNTSIPNNYIVNPALRIKFYKRLSNQKNIETINEVLNEIIDQYGTCPKELNNLILILKSRVALQGLGIKRLKTLTQSIVIYFNKPQIEENEILRNKIVSFFIKRPKIYKINPDFSIICNFKDKITVNDLYEFSKHIKENI